MQLGRPDAGDSEHDVEPVRQDLGVEEDNRLGLERSEKATNNERNQKVLTRSQETENRGTTADKKKTWMTMTSCGRRITTTSTGNSSQQQSQQLQQQQGQRPSQSTRVTILFMRAEPTDCLTYLDKRDRRMASRSCSRLCLMRTNSCTSRCGAEFMGDARTLTGCVSDVERVDGRCCVVGGR